MFAFVQPFGLSSPAGGPRILRSLLKENSHPFLSICTSPTPPPKTTVGEEIHLPIRPNFYRLERSRFAKYLGSALPLCANNFKKGMEEILVKEKVSAIHAIPHGLDFAYTFEVATKLGLPYYLNIHDELDYNLKGHVELDEAERQLAHVWRESTNRMVISEAMGAEYSRRYGARSYTVVTDGLEKISRSKKNTPSQNLQVYFMGSVHLSYRENFSSLVFALEKFSENNPEWNVSLTIRGELPFPLPNVKIPTEYLPWGTESEVAQDMDDIDLLYLPLPFGEAHQSFSRYSLSTKMVTYLGSGIPILCHAPQDAAATQLLSNANAGITITSLDPNLIAKALHSPDRPLDQVVENAFNLAHSQFMLTDVQSRFWNVLHSHITPSVTLVQEVDSSQSNSFRTTINV